MASPEFLELLNSLISSSEIPGLYTTEEVDHIFPDPEEIRREYYGKTFYEAFCDRIKANLRVVLSMNHKSENFSHSTAANPALFTKCTVIWLDNWTKDGMYKIMKNELD